MSVLPTGTDRLEALLQSKPAFALWSCSIMWGALDLFINYGCHTSA